MSNKFIIKLLSFILLVAMLAGSLFACFDESLLSSTSSSSTTGGSVSTTIVPTTRPTTTTRPTASTTTTRPTATTRPTTTGNGGGDVGDCIEHIDNDAKNSSDYGWCDVCGADVIETIDFYNFNDLHGKFEDGDAHPGVDELTAYLEHRITSADEYTVLLSSGDMWQGGNASNTTKGKIITDWMNYLGFAAMALGNHEFDWGSDMVRENSNMAEFPILGINIYDNATGERVDYCEASVMIERGGVQIGIIGAIGDCHSSIAKDKNQDFNFKVGNELTNLVKAESQKLRSEGADVIVYLLHSDDADYDLYRACARRRDVQAYPAAC